MREPITIVLFTHRRLDYALQTLRSLCRWVQYEGPLRLHIADDHSSRDEVRRLWDFAHEYGIWDRERPTLTVAGGRGYGGSYNAASQTVHNSPCLVLPLEDDWELTGSLDLTPFADDLVSNPELECIRMGYVGWTQPLRGMLFEASNPTAVGAPAHRKYVIFDPASEERHVFAGHPRLETLDFERRVGPWPEGIGAGATEFEVSGRPESRIGVAWPEWRASMQEGIFRHFGTVSYKHELPDSRPAEEEDNGATEDSEATVAEAVQRG